MLAHSHANSALSTFHLTFPKIASLAFINIKTDHTLMQAIQKTAVTADCPEVAKIRKIFVCKDTRKLIVNVFLGLKNAKSVLDFSLVWNPITGTRRTS